MISIARNPIDRFMVDFYGPELMLAIEIDGDSHGEKHPGDCQRQARLESLGVRFLRFEDWMVKRDRDNVVRAMEGWMVENTPRGTGKESS